MLWNPQTNKFAVAKLKFSKIPKSKDYPSGIKYSLFAVYDGSIIVGFYNHKPKGPHLHFGENELPYDFKNESKLLADFWDLTRKAGFEI